jgi:hypothetical protein
MHGAKQSKRDLRCFETAHILMHASVREPETKRALGFMNQETPTIQEAQGDEKVGLAKSFV